VKALAYYIIAKIS